MKGSGWLYGVEGDGRPRLGRADRPLSQRFPLLLCLTSRLTRPLWQLVRVTEKKEGRCKVSVEQVKVCVDKLSFTASEVDLKGVVYGLEKAECVVNAGVWRTPPYDSFAETHGGLLVLTKDRGYDEKSIRVEYNPAKADEQTVAELSLILGCVRGRAKVTRIDVAVDYIGETPDNWTWYKPNVSEARYYGRDKALETHNFGKADCTEQVSVYDKRRELKSRGEPCEHDQWLRVEARRRPQKADGVPLPSTMFDDLHIWTGGWEKGSGLALNERAMMALLEKQPEALSEIRASRRKRWLELIADNCRTLDPHPGDVYKEHRSRLVSGLLRQTTSAIYWTIPA